MQITRTAALSLMLLCSWDQSFPSSASAQSGESETYVHRGSGFGFPSSVGEFTRVRITEFNTDGTDIGAGYNLQTADKQIAVTVYVYPAPPASAGAAQSQACLEQFREVKAALERAHPAARAFQESIIPSPIPGTEAGRRAVYSFDGVFAGRQVGLRSEADLYCYVAGPWFVKFRTTAPENINYTADLQQLMRGLKWPTGP